MEDAPAELLYSQIDKERGREKATERQNRKQSERKGESRDVRMCVLVPGDSSRQVVSLRSSLSSIVLNDLVWGSGGRGCTGRMTYRGAHSCDIVSSLLVAPQVCLQSLPSLLPALAGTVAHRSARLIWERESSRGARGKEREREIERKQRITKTTEEADLTNPRAYKGNGMQK